MYTIINDTDQYSLYKPRPPVQKNHTYILICPKWKLNLQCHGNLPNNMTQTK